ncbi:ABC transporter substrate-binding protein [Uliginosibacterium paludis]|uniref:ABC transporter substrate-binding protein n=1 Tax=Uliginosibacterium paludis TaxID=1615952 RepID=A0ABV2CMJ5_9RHOO
MNRRAFLAGSLSAAVLQAMPGRAWAQDGGNRQAIVVGQSVDLSGLMQNIGRDYFTGAKVAFDQLNQSGGIGGRSIRLLQLDDGGEPARAVANATELIENSRADVLFGFCSEACVEAVSRSEVFRRSGVDLFAPLSGLDHDAARGRAVYLHPGSAEEMQQIIRRLSNMTLSRLAIIHTESASMLASVKAAVAGLPALGIEKPRDYVLKDGASNAAALIKAVAADRIQAVIIMADAFSASQLLKPMRAASPALFICLGSMVDVATVQQILGAGGAQGMMVARAVPDPANTLIPVVASFKKTLARYMDEAPTAMSLEGYMAAQALIAVLRKSDSPSRLAQNARNRIGTLDLGGWKVELANERASERIQLAMLTRDGRFI